MKTVSRILLFIIITSFTSNAQERYKHVSQDRSSIEKRNIERQLLYASSLESRGDIVMSYNVHNQLVEKFPGNLQILRGYLEISLKAEKIKECEIRLKQIAKKYSVSEKYIDPGNEKDSYGVMVQGVLSEFFLRTGREQQAYMVFDGLEKVNASEKFISEVKANAFFNAGYNKNAEKIYLNLRKELKSEDLYSEELYRIYLSEHKIVKFTKELLKQVSLNEKKHDRDYSGTNELNPKAELFSLFEQEEYTDSILETAKTAIPNSRILSELYYNKGQYDLSYQVLKNSGSEKSVEFLAAGFAFSLYQDQKYKEAVGFFEIAYSNERFSKDMEFIEHYSLSLARSGLKQKSEELIKSSNIRYKELMLAKLYHNELNDFDKADQLYSKYLTSDKNHSPYWRDYIDLKIVRRDFDGAKKLLKKVFDEQIIEILTNITFYEFKYKDALLEFLSGDNEMFRQKADQMIRDTETSDYDNDLLKILNDMNIFENDENLSEAYKEILLYRINSKATIKEIKIDFREMNEISKKKLSAELQFEYLAGKKDNIAILDLFNSIISEGIIDNISSRKFIDFAKRTELTVEITDLLFSILKSAIDESLKSEVREMLRGKDLS